jgi:hypothetical protein
MSGITFLKSLVAKGQRSSQVTVNVELNGAPFGQLWTWPNTRTEFHLWHSKPLDGDHKLHNTLREAKQRMIDENSVIEQSMQAD